MGCPCSDPLGTLQKGNTAGVVLSYDNSSLEYGKSGGGTISRGFGGGPGSQGGGSGIVIVRIKK